ncbi:MAG: AAA family ATPase [Oscillochloridaceae bacterium umkhey_bin13]
MIPTQLTLSNFMCYRADGDEGSPPTLNLDGLHVVCLAGENGAGKSTLLDAITWALWGEARIADDELIAQGTSEMSVELEFLLAEQPYRIRRARQRGGTGKRGGQTTGKSQLDLMVRNGAGWKTLTELKISETQERINDLLRMSYRTFTNASFLIQGRADAFTASTPAERKQILAEILDLGEYALLEARAKERAKELEAQLRSLRGQLEALRESAARLPFWLDQVNEAEQKLVLLDEAVRNAEQIREAAIRRQTELEQQAALRKQLLAQIGQLRQTQAARAREQADLAQQITADQTLLGRREAIVAGLAELTSARAELARLNTVQGEYQRLLGERQTLQAELKAALSELKGELAQLQSQRDQVRATAAPHATLTSELAALEQRLAALEPLASEQTTLQTERQTLADQLARVHQLRLRRSDLSATIERELAALRSAQAEQERTITRLTSQLAQLPGWQLQLEQARAAQTQIQSLETDVAALRQAEQTAIERAAAERAATKAAHAEAERLKKSKALLEGEAQTCPVCRSDLGADGIARAHAHYDEDLTALRARYSEAKREADQAEAHANTLRTQLTSLERTLADLRPQAARSESLERQLADAASWQRELVQAQATVAELTTQLATSKVAPEAQTELAHLEAELALQPDPTAAEQRQRQLDQRLRELGKQISEQGRIEATIQAKREALAQAELALRALPAADQAVTALETRIQTNDYAPEIRQRGRSVEAAINELGYSEAARTAAAETVKRLEPWEQEERRLALAEQRLATNQRLAEQAAQLAERDQQELTRLEAEEASLATAVAGLAAAEQATRQAEAALRERRQALHVAQKDAGEKQAYLRRAQQDTDELARREADETALAQRHGLFAELTEAFGKKGVQAMLIEAAIPQIEDEANRLLARMTDGQMHLSFEMQRDTRKGETVETLEIKIADALGTRVYDAFSGGEAMRANFAVRIALSRLLARRAGARLETLVIDEGFGTLDALGRERMVEAITSVQADFRRIIVVTHIDDLKDRFPAQIVITKTTRGSRWELR